MTVFTRIAIAAICLASAAGWVLVAQSEPAEHGPDGAAMGDHFFAEFDLNRDGKVTQDEMNQVHAKHFAAADTNHDGTVDAQEFYQFGLTEYRQHAEGMFKMLDRNGDGKLSKDEIPQHGPGFAALDRNNDGAITRDELPAHPGMWHHMHHDHGGPMGPEMGPGPGYGNGPPPPDSPPGPPPGNPQGGE